MSFNIYNQEEEQRFVCDVQFENLEKDYPQMTDQYYITSQSTFQTKQSLKKENTGQSKQIRKIKKIKKPKIINQYEKEGKNFIIQRFSSIEEEGKLNNPKIDVFLKEIKMIKRKIKQLNLH